MSKFDVVIIGSGLGGLECGYILSKEGYSVCILEKNRQIGGNLQTFVRDKVIFDTGIHYIGGLNPGQNLHRYFQYFGLMDKLNLRKMDESGFDRVTFEGDPTEYKYAQGYEEFEAQMCEHFPQEKEAIRKYCSKLIEISRFFPLYNLEPRGVDIRKAPYLEIDTQAYIESLTDNHKLRQVLAGTNPLYAGESHKTPLYVHALVINTYIESSWKCVDGGSQIARALAKSIKGMGGIIRNYKEAKQFVFKDDTLTAVEMADGEQVEGKYFISNIHPTQTLAMLEPNRVRKSYRNRIAELENTISVFTIHIVFHPKSFPYLNHNYYHYKINDVWDSVNYKKENWPEGYALFVPANSKDEEYADSMNVMCYMRYEEVAEWADTFQTIPKHQNGRGQDYESFKKEKAEKLLDELEKKFPGIRSKIKSYYSSTPLSYRDYIGTTDGSMYGIAKDYKSPLKTFISPRTKIPNLYLTGQNLNMHGVLGVTVGAMVTCAEFLGLNYLLEKVKKS